MRPVGLTLASLLLLGLCVAAAPARLANVQISKDSQKGVKDCGGGMASILSNKNHLTLKNCAKVTVEGNKNNLVLESCQAVEVPGNDNTVNAGWVKSISTLGNRNTVHYKLGPKEEKPSVANPGTGNKIEAEK